MSWFQWLALGVALLGVVLLLRILRVVSTIREEQEFIRQGLTDCFERIFNSLERIEDGNDGHPSVWGMGEKDKKE